MTESAAPGWYNDTAAGAPPGRQRYWDGRAWTQQLHDSVASVSPRASFAEAAARAPKVADANAAVTIPLGQAAAIVAVGALVLGVMQHATSGYAHLPSAFPAWITLVALPIALIVVTAAALRKTTRWDLVARDGAIAIAAATLIVIFISKTVPSHGTTRLEFATQYARPRFGQFFNVADWYRYVFADMIGSALVGACAAAAVFWNDKKRLPFAVGGAAAAGAGIALVLSPIHVFGYASPLNEIIPLALWLPATIAAAIYASGMADKPGSAFPVADASGSMYAQPGMSSGVSRPNGNYELATIGSRFGARVIDALIVGVIFILIAFIVIALAASSSSSSAVGGLLVFLLLLPIAGLLWEPLWLIKRGATPGKKIVGIRVIREDTGGALGAGKAWGRVLLPAAWLWIPFVGFVVQLVAYLTAFGDDRNRTWMDKAAGTIVVREASVRTATSAPMAWPPTTPLAPQPWHAAAPVVPQFPPAVAEPFAPPSYSPVQPIFAVSPMIENVPGIASVPPQPPVAQASPAPAAPRMFDDFDPNATMHASDIARLVRATSFTLVFSDGQRKQLLSGRLLVGRDPQIVGDGGGVQVLAIEDAERLTSRTHLAFDVRNDQLSVEDSFSANGSAVVGTDGAQRPLIPGTPATLTDGCRVIFGGCQVSISVP